MYETREPSADCPERGRSFAGLAGVTAPEVLRGLEAGCLTSLAGEIRALLVEKVCATGGHQGPKPLPEAMIIDALVEEALHLAEAPAPATGETV